MYRTKKKANQIVSIGGGIPQKNNLLICRAINKLNEENKMNLKYIVIGLTGRDKDEICSYDFVTYYEKLSHEEVIEILAGSQMYIQNSVFETFGLAIIEALLSDCILLISNNIGAISVLKTIENRDLIFNINDVDEISSKIKYLLSNNNTIRLKHGLDTEKVAYTTSAELLYKKIFSIWEKSGE
ncbi:glycosyltransferase [Streptococcus suis]